MEGLDFVDLSFYFVQVKSGLNVTELYKSAYNEGGQVKVESHPMWTQLLSVVTGESSASSSVVTDDELEMTQSERNTICPISKKEMVFPVKNSDCGHIYDRESIVALIKQKPNFKCPTVGCPSNQPVKIGKLREDKELRLFINKRRN